MSNPIEVKTFGHNFCLSKEVLRFLNFLSAIVELIVIRAVYGAVQPVMGFFCTTPIGCSFPCGLHLTCEGVGTGLHQVRFNLVVKCG